MTPSEKAKELFEKFRAASRHKYIERTGQDADEMGKILALICVDQIIEGIESVIGDQKHMWREGEKQQHQYYIKVLEHIKNS